MKYAFKSNSSRQTSGKIQRPKYKKTAEKKSYNSKSSYNFTKAECKRVNKETYKFFEQKVKENEEKGNKTYTMDTLISELDWKNYPLNYYILKFNEKIGEGKHIRSSKQAGMTLFEFSRKSGYIRTYYTKECNGKKHQACFYTHPDAQNENQIPQNPQN